MEDDKDMYAAYFGRSTDYYLAVLERFKNGSRFVFNPYALLLGHFWFLFRKMYIEVFVFFSISVLLGVAQVYLFKLPGVASVSYTHLDVYKRQQRNTASQITSGRPIPMFHA